MQVMTLTDDQFLEYLIKELHKPYNESYNAFRFAIGVRITPPLNKSFLAIECSVDNIVWIELSTVPKNIFDIISAGTEFHFTSIERGWEFSSSTSRTKEEMNVVLEKSTRQGIISDLLSDIENEVR